MSGRAPGKVEIMGARVYIHRNELKNKSIVLHIDVESPELNRIIKDGERTYCGGKNGGVFIGLKKEMTERAKEYLANRKGPFL
jgi:hypothetical protein